MSDVPEQLAGKDPRDVLADRIQTWADTEDWHVYDYVDRLINDLDAAGYEIVRRVEAGMSDVPDRLDAVRAAEARLADYLADRDVLVAEANNALLADRIQTWADTEDWHVYDYVDRAVRAAEVARAEAEARLADYLADRDVVVAEANNALARAEAAEALLVPLREQNAALKEGLTKAKIREVIVANMLDGQEGGRITFPDGSRMADDIAESIAWWVECLLEPDVLRGESAKKETGTVLIADQGVTAYEDGRDG